MEASPLKVIFLLPYPLGRAPSQRFRVEMLLPLLQQQEIEYVLRPFISEKTWNILYKGGSVFRKISGIAGGFLKRSFTVIFEAPKYHCIFIHREAAPLGPPIFEWYLAKVLKKKIIYDFDDAIWIPNTSAENSLVNLFKASGKVSKICKWSSVISAGNQYLCRFAESRSSARVVRMPTVVDTTNRYPHAKQHTGGAVTIGWTGSHSTLKYLDMIVPVLRYLRKDTDFTFLVIADKRPDLNLDNFSFISWNAGTEIEDLMKIDIGIMPLQADEWAEGKCGFKLIQYLALGIPAIASVIGVNKEIIQEGVNGYLCSEEEDWVNALKQLIQDSVLRQHMGTRGRQKIVKEYSIEGNKENFLNLFHPLIGEGPASTS